MRPDVYRQHSRALTVRQPWASLIAAGLKSREIRTWGTSHRGPLWIHAGAAIVPGADELPRGVLLARVQVVGCVPEENVWAWLLRDVRPLSEPVPCRGAQGVWRLSPALLLEALARLPR